MNYPEIRYLERLADLYPTIASASTEVINMEAILNLPKGTEHFLTDIHGEDEAFAHVLKNGSGSVRRKVNEVFGNTLSHQDKRTLATLIYYPREKMDQILKVTEDLSLIHILEAYFQSIFRPTSPALWEADAELPASAFWPEAAAVSAGFSVVR